MFELWQRQYEQGRISFRAGPGGLPVALLEHEGAQAELCIHGAHALHYRPAGGEDVLWLSGASWYEDGKPIRGGIPVCWPWFGPHPTDAAAPGHGFARLRLWELADSKAAPDETAITLRLRDDAQTRQAWPYAFELTLRMTLSDHLRLDLTTYNRGPEPFRITQALHNYLAVRDVTAIRILGLEEAPYMDKANHYTLNQERAPITICGETNRIYTNTSAECLLDDPLWPRRLRIGKGGSRTTVVWNPWIENARRMPDFGDDEYRGMVCVETANAGPEVITVPPGAAHTLTTMLAAEGEEKGESVNR